MDEIRLQVVIMRASSTICWPRAAPPSTGIPERGVLGIGINAGGDPRAPAVLPS
jgi:hypothetical protein